MAEKHGSVDELFKEITSLEGTARAARLVALRARDEQLAGRIAEMVDRFEKMEQNIFESSVLPKGMLSAFSDDEDDDEVEITPDRFDDDRETAVRDEMPALGPAGRARAASQADPETIGKYKVLRKVGEGGMGLVYLVRQEEPRRDLALKLLAQHRTTVEFRARFEAEYRVLALMNHHNIAAMHEVGHTESGQVYFTMEYVKGIPITAYCAEKKLDLRQRLLLFRQVCEGVLHAHQKAVVHRDLKPSNILVTEQNDRPVVKIIDFGIAKGLEDSLVERRFETRVGTLMGTLEYMSHEQLLGMVDTDTRCDIYSLGVVLYEMLVEAMPLQSDTLINASTETVLRFFRETEAPAPSQRLKTLVNERDHAKTIDYHELRGDLDWIVLKAMEKDVDRRFATIGELKRDIAAFLDDEPVSARSPSFSYVMKKFVRRNRIFVGSGALVIGAMVVGLWISIWSNIRVNNAKFELEAALSHLETSNAFLQDMLGAADPNNVGANAKVVDVLARAEERLETANDLQPEAEASIRVTLGKTFDGLGLYAKSAGHLEKAYAFRLSKLGQKHPLTMDVRELLAQALRRGGKKDVASMHYAALIKDLTEVLGPEHPKTLNARTSHDICLLKTHDLEALFQDLNDIYSTQGRIFGENHPDSLRTLSIIAAAFYTQGDFEKAVEYYRVVYNAYLQILGERDPKTLAMMKNLAANLMNGEKFVEALDILDDLLKIRIEALGTKHPNTTRVKLNYGNCLVKLNQDLDRAEALLGDVIDTHYEQGTLDSSDSFLAANYLAMALSNGGNPKAGLEILREYEDMFMSTHQKTWWMHYTIHNQGRFSMAAGLYEQAYERARLAYELRREFEGPQGQMTLDTLCMISQIQIKRGLFEEGFDGYCNALAQVEAAETPYRWHHRKDYADILMETGYLDIAAEQLNRIQFEAPKRILDILDLDSSFGKLSALQGQSTGASARN